MIPLENRIEDLEKENSELKTRLTQAENNINAKVNGAKRYWGNEFQFNMQSPQQALVLIGTGNLISCWYSGGGFSYKNLIGSGIIVTEAEHTVTIKLGDNTSFTAAAFIF